MCKSAIFYVSYPLPRFVELEGILTAANTTSLDFDQDIVISEFWKRNSDDCELLRLGVPMVRGISQV
jgi:hypothetical protein